MKNPDLNNKLAPFVLFGSITIALVLVGVARYSGYKDQIESSGQVVASCDLRFEDRPSGVVDVYSEGDGRLLGRFERGDGSFVRGILRSMTRERRSRDLGSEAPFRLARYSDGALTIRDEATGRQIYLDAFGTTNADVFKRLLSASRAES
jgi:putative photosynthetic complex assembly protein